MSDKIKIGVIGHPVAQSKSPLIHNHWLEKYGIPGEYKAIDIAPENLKDSVQNLIDEGYIGFNITIPYKEKIIDFCEDIDVTAEQIGAVNTVVIGNGKLYGQNTDAFGFIENIKQSHPAFDFKNKSALVLGAGGAAKGIIYGLLQQGVAQIFVANRTKEKAENLAQHFTNLDVVEWCSNYSSLSESNLLINATSLGMGGQPPLEINLSNLNPQTLVCDIVYKPLMTDLLQKAQDNHNDIVTGIGMLLQQARPAFKSWTNIMPDIDDDLMQKALS